MAGLTTARPPILACLPRTASFGLSVYVFALFAWCVQPDAAHAQFARTEKGQDWVGVPKKQPSKPGSAFSKRKGETTSQMLVQADEIHYDYNNQRVSAVGQVQIYYKNSTLEADQVIYDQKTKRLRAEGNARLVDADGKVVHGEILDLSDDYRDGFVDSLRVDTPDKTHFAATRADRVGGRTTVFQSGVYTACEPCKDDPRKPPRWQIKAARIIHDEAEKLIYFENARLEFFGIPLLWAPYFSTPDPTVKRKTGFLAPVISTNTKYGYAITTPYFWALAPDYDLTLTPTLTSKQGPLMQAEFRQRLIDGSYSIRAAGIIQADKDEFLRDGAPPTPGFRDNRGSIESSGQFNLNDKWVWGWDALLLSDRTFLLDYNLSAKFLSSSTLTSTPFITTPSEGISQFYVAGRGDRSYFDARVVHYLGFSEFDQQSELPVIHPVIDYGYTFGQPILGGELSYNINFTSLSRSDADFDPITQTAVTNGDCEPTADPARKTRTDCVLRGTPGNYTRLSGQTTWRRTITDSYGQVFTPFASVRADVAALSVTGEPGVSNFLPTGDDGFVRAMPAVGIEYRYPFIAVQPWGTQTIEPVAQIIARPNEQNIGKVPNEDAQSLIYDDSNLFRVDKFSGWDRVEGGTRANVGVQYTAQFNRAGFVNVLFGQSYQLFGKNSFAVADTVNTGLDSGLETSRSDYVARVAYQPDRIYSFISRFRFDEESFNVRRFEAEARANFDRWGVSMLYGNYDKQPEIGYLTRREGILGTATTKITTNWSLLGSARYDLDASRFDQYRVGLGYIDDCFAIAVNYITDYAYSSNPTVDHRVMLQINLRTLGGTGFSQRVGGTE
jgi:LPS-assembly protein